jgi:hypothetical protein
MEEKSTAGLKHGGRVTICQHLLCVATGSYLVLFLDSLSNKTICGAYRNCSRAYEQVVERLIPANLYIMGNLLSNLMLVALIIPINLHISHFDRSM